MQHSAPSPPSLVFCVAAPLDASWLARWERHLIPLQQAGHLTIWSLEHLQPGTSRIEQIDAHLQRAHVICLLLTANFFASEECYTLMKRALQRQQENFAHVIPLLLRPVVWQESPLATLSCLPSNGVPVTSWKDPEQAFQDCVEGVLRTIGRPVSASLRHRSFRIMNIQQRNREAMLRRLHRSYTDLMCHSLQGAAWLELGLSEEPAAVQNPVTLLLRLSKQLEQPLPPGTSILQAYDRAMHELLILGEPGAGKSTMLLDLAQQLVKQAEQDEAHPLPVILPLSSWAVKRLPLQDWIVEQLVQLYGIPQRQSEQWMREEIILPLLDGLDEMDEAARPACIAAINAYHHTHLPVPLVVCSRKTEYEAASVHQRLTLQNAVILQPLTRELVDDYLLQAGKPLTALRSFLRKNETLRGLATTPLMLSVLMFTYQGTTIRELPSKGTLLQRQVWDDYIRRMVERKGDIKRYPLQRTRSWLAWLARQLRERNQTIFYLEHLQSDWLSTGEQQVYREVAVRVPAILIGILVSLLVLLFLSGPLFLPVALQQSILGGLLGGLWCEATPQKRDSPSGQYGLHHTWRTGLLMAIFVGLFFGLSFGGYLGAPNDFNGALYTFNDWLRDGLLSGVLVGLGALLLQFLSRKISYPSVLTGTDPKQHRPWLVRLLQTRSAQHTWQGATIIGLSLGLSTGLSDGIAIEPGRGLSFALSDGLIGGLGVGLDKGLSYVFISLLLSLTVTGLAENIRLSEHLHWTWGGLRRSLFAPSHLRRAILVICLVVPLTAFSAVLAEWNYLGPAYWPYWVSVALSTGLSFGISYWLLSGLFQGIEQIRVEDEDRRVPNQGIRQSVFTGAIMGLIGAAIIGTIYVLNSGLSNALSGALISNPDYANYALFDGLSKGLSMAPLICILAGCFIGLLSGGVAALRHLTLRFLLARSQTFPWQAVPFLDDTGARVLLRRVGGGYSFIHRLLLDYFADLDSDV